MGKILKLGLLNIICFMSNYKKNSLGFSKSCDLYFAQKKGILSGFYCIYISNCN